jgi:hypothetical protein
MENINYSSLLDYISYFEDDKVKFCEWRGGEKHNNYIVMSYPNYDKKLSDFVQVVYDSGIMMKDYMEHLQDIIGVDRNMKQIIDYADFDTLRALLTYHIREERFCDGAWEDSANNGIFLAMLIRLQQLMNKEV